MANDGVNIHIYNPFDSTNQPYQQGAMSATSDGTSGSQSPQTQQQNINQQSNQSNGNPFAAAVPQNPVAGAMSTPLRTGGGTVSGQFVADHPGVGGGGGAGDGLGGGGGGGNGGGGGGGTTTTPPGKNVDSDGDGWNDDGTQHQNLPPGYNPDGTRIDGWKPGITNGDPAGVKPEPFDDVVKRWTDGYNGKVPITAQIINDWREYNANHGGKIDPADWLWYNRGKYFADNDPTINAELLKHTGRSGQDTMYNILFTRGGNTPRAADGKGIVLGANQSGPQEQGYDPLNPNGPGWNADGTPKDSGGAGGTTPPADPNNPNGGGPQPVDAHQAQQFAQIRAAIKAKGTQDILEGERQLTAKLQAANPYGDVSGGAGALQEKYMKEASTNLAASLAQMDYDTFNKEQDRILQKYTAELGASTALKTAQLGLEGSQYQAQASSAAAGQAAAAQRFAAEQQYSLGIAGLDVDRERNYYNYMASIFGSVPGFLQALYPFSPNAQVNGPPNIQDWIRDNPWINAYLAGGGN